MDIGIVSARYSKALLKYAIENGEEERVYEEMLCISNAFIANTQIRKTLLNPILTEAQKRSLLLSAIGATTISKSTHKFVDLLILRHRINLVQFISNSYINQYRTYKHITIGYITIPMKDLAEDIREKIRQWIKAQVHKSIDLRIKTDPMLLGGFILEYDTYRIDASIKTQLKNIKKLLLPLREVVKEP